MDLKPKIIGLEKDVLRRIGDFDHHYWGIEGGDVIPIDAAPWYKKVTTTKVFSGSYIDNQWDDKNFTTYTYYGSCSQTLTRVSIKDVFLDNQTENTVWLGYGNNDVYYKNCFTYGFENGPEDSFVALNIAQYPLFIGVNIKWSVIKVGHYVVTRDGKAEAPMDITIDHLALVPKVRFNADIHTGALAASSIEWDYDTHYDISTLSPTELRDLRFTASAPIIYYRNGNIPVQVGTTTITLE